MKLQRKLIAENRRVLVIIEGRDGAGKEGTIKRLTEHIVRARRASTRLASPQAARKPSGISRGSFRSCRRPANFVFNRSWYNRAGVELVMGFCTKEQVEEFFKSVGPLKPC